MIYLKPCTNKVSCNIKILLRCTHHEWVEIVVLCFGKEIVKDYHQLDQFLTDLVDGNLSYFHLQYSLFNSRFTCASSGKFFGSRDVIQRGGKAKGAQYKNVACIYIGLLFLGPFSLWFNGISAAKNFPRTHTKKWACLQATSGILHLCNNHWSL